MFLNQHAAIKRDVEHVTLWRLSLSESRHCCEIKLLVCCGLIRSGVSFRRQEGVFVNNNLRLLVRAPDRVIFPTWKLNT